MINRVAIMVKPAQPFLDWLHLADPTSAHLTLHDLRREPTIYLVRESDREDKALEFLDQNAAEIFEEQLNGWYRVAASWPPTRDLATFSFHSMVVDLCLDPFEHEEM